jgi:hypothetical protein
VSRAEALASALPDGTSKPAKRLAAGPDGPPSEGQGGSDKLRRVRRILG